MIKPTYTGANKLLVAAEACLKTGNCEQIMKKIILHIGCEKTGTTSIQNTLTENRDLLLKKHGILYPESLGKRNHINVGIYSCDEDKHLTKFLPRGQSISEFRRRLYTAFSEEAASKHFHTVVISNEWLHPRIQSPTEFQRLSHLLNQVSTDIEIVMYIRRQDKLALSMYSTSLKAGNYQHFTFPDIGDNASLPYYYDFLAIYRRWKEVFGNNITLRVFDRETLCKQNVVNDFLTLINCNENALQIQREDNRSISPAGIKVMRSLNWLLHKLRQVIHPRVARLIRHNIAKLFPGTTKLASDTQCQDFQDNFTLNNRLLQREYELDTGRRLCPSRKLLFPSKRQDKSVCDKVGPKRLRP